MKASKYNKSEIFKAAWKLVKTAGKSISEALKAAWAAVKNPYKVHELGMIVSDKALNVTFEISFNQIKERGWLKKVGATWNPAKKLWVLTTSPVQIGSSAFYGQHTIPAHLVDFIKDIKVA